MSLPISYNVRSLWQRKSRTALTVVGIAAVIAIFVVMVSFAQSMSASFARTGSADNVVVLQRSAFSQSLSALPRNSGDVVRYFEHIRHKAETPLVSPELAVEPWVTGTHQRGEVFMMARGVDSVFFDVVDQVKMREGSADLRGNRVLLGPAARHKLGGANIGDTLVFFGERWTIVGYFEAGGSSLELSILADLNDLMRAAQRDELSSFTIKAASAREVPRLVQLLENDRRVLVTAMPETQYYISRGKSFAIVSQLGLLVSVIVSLGAIFGGMNTMYSAVSGRTREIGALRALGFSKTSILISFLTESGLIALVGGILGVALGCLVEGTRINIMTASVRFSVTLQVALGGLVLAALVGLLGGLPPALRASRVRVIEALKHV